MEEHFPIAGGDVYSLGGGPEYDSFPIERNVSFFLNVTQGTVFQYILELDDGTFLTNSSTSPVDYIFPEVNCACTDRRMVYQCHRAYGKMLRNLLVPKSAWEDGGNYRYLRGLHENKQKQTDVSVLSRC